MFCNYKILPSTVRPYRNLLVLAAHEGEWHSFKNVSIGCYFRFHFFRLHALTCCELRTNDELMVMVLAICFLISIEQQWTNGAAHVVVNLKERKQ